jgi:nucleoside-diphosphate-sugar epimerase
MPTISIFGCGWVGKALLPILEPDYQLKSSVRSQSSFETLPCQEKYLLNEHNDYYDPDFYDTDILIIAIPPREHYETTIKKLLSYIKVATQIILLSSTSVYDQTEGLVDENSTKVVSNPSKMLKMEHFLQENHQKLLILRLAGLMGYGRIAGRHSSGKTFQHDGYVNYIHRDDVVAIIKHLIDHGITSDVLNLVAPHHPSKKMIFDNNAKKYNFQPPKFISTQQRSKKVSSQKLQEKYHYKFLKPDPLEFW